MPMAISDIKKFEKQNKNMIINVYGCDENGENIYPRRICKRRDKEAINLLLLQNEEKYHYVLIQNLNRLMDLGKIIQKNVAHTAVMGLLRNTSNQGK